LDPSIRYSEAFKREVVRELEDNGVPFAEVRRKYGVRGAGTVEGWARKYGNGTRGRRIRVEKPEEIDELARLRKRVRQLETAVADQTVELAMERAYLRMACRQAGIEDVEAFKKKGDGKPGMKP
jgi:transposase-like protein